MPFPEYREPCYKCCPTRNKVPILVTRTRVEPCTKDPCGKPCYVHTVNPFPSISSANPKSNDITVEKMYPTDCKKCLKIIDEKNLQIRQLEQEAVKLMTDLLTLPKRDNADDDDADIQHNYKGLRDIEQELLKRDQELAKMKLEACDEVCYNTLRQKQLELRWKDLELERRQSNTWVRYLGDLMHKYSDKKQHKKQHNCFKKINKKERKLIKREAEIDNDLEKLREQKYEELMALYKQELEFRRRPIEFDVDTDCSCDCAKINEMQEEERRAQDKILRDACCNFPLGAYIPFWTNDTIEHISEAGNCLRELYAKQRKHSFFVK